MSATPMRQGTGLADAAGIRHGFFTRRGGVSQGAYESLNCAVRSKDSPEAVAENRRRVGAVLGAGTPVTAYQIHGRTVLQVESRDSPPSSARGDALVTRSPGVVLGVLTADCVPVLLADPSAGVIGAAHAGWQGAALDIMDAAVRAMEALGADRAAMTADVGPAISAARYEVDEAVRSRFPPETAADFFTATDRDGHWLFDLPGFVTARLAESGVGRVERMTACTFDDESFFSRRRALSRGGENYGCQMSAIVLGEPD